MTDPISDLPIVFILGLSGVGKSKLGEYSEDSDFLYIEQDSTEGNGIDIWGLRNDWDNYLNDHSASSLAKTIREKTELKVKKGAVLTFSSVVTLSIKDIECAKQSGINTILLYGTDDDCLNSYLKREQESGRGYGKNRWLKYNTDSSAKFSSNDYEPFREQVFDNHEHKSRSYLIEMVNNKINESGHKDYLE